VHVLHLRLNLALEPLDLRVCLPKLVLEPEDELDAREIESELGGEPLDDAEPFEGTGIASSGASQARSP
jgi:hypothetical protein